MTLTYKQEEGLRIAVERYRLGEKYTIIAGFAGTGKSTLIKYIIHALDLQSDNVAYITYTGKAANVLKNKGCANAMTAHKLLYHAKLLPSGRYKYTPKLHLESELKVVVVDEVSMLPLTLWNLLCSHNVYIIACGDPGQLPPISANENNHILDHPHIFLDEIMRQAWDSEIIRLSMHIRQGKSLSSFHDECKEVRILSPNEVTTGMLLWADQVLCAKNQTRHYLNKIIRQALKMPAQIPAIGDKIICLHNEWDILSTHNNPLTNGIIGKIHEMSIKTVQLPRNIIKPNLYPELTCVITGDEKDEFFINLKADYNEIITSQPTYNGEQEYKIIKQLKSQPPLHFNYGYAITTWKAQGSEWPKVLGYEENFPFESEEHQRYLYTLITRAQEKLVLVKSGG